MSLTSVPADTASVPDRMAPLTHHLAHWARTTGGDTAVTFLDYAASPDGLARSLTWTALDRRVTAVATRLQRTVNRGDRVALLVPQGLDYLVAFLGALRAGVIAVPLFAPDLPGHGDRLAAVVGDCEPACVVTTAAVLDLVKTFLAEQGTDPAVIAVDLVDDQVPDDEGNDFRPVEVDLDEAAYLQYTSGSTRTPSGVIISHRNIVTNCLQGFELYGAEYGRSTLISWLPLFHDMGLVLTSCGGVVFGVPTVFTDPVAFLVKPVRWLEMMSRYPGGITAAPNFAFDYCAKRIPAEERAGLRLENADLMINAAEPVQAETMERFVEAFAPYGLRPEVLSGAYGLAEATVLVACSPFDEEPAVRLFDFEQLSRGVAETVDAGAARAQRLVACGFADNPENETVAIVDTETLQPLPAGRIGEIWVHGANVARGYWKKDEDSAETFGARLSDPALPAGPWLRSGDLGAFVEGDLYVTGRIKDLIILDGRNHYPQDLEVTVENAHDAIARHRVAAFSVPVGGASGTGDSGEGIVIVAEISRHLTADQWDGAAVATAVRRAVSARHAVAVHDVVLVVHGDVPRTSSGKIARAATRTRYLDNTLTLAGTA